jgi:hypothetical protein
MYVEIQAAVRGVGSAAGRMIGRTSVIRPGIGSQEGYSWEQDFKFEDLGGEVRLVVWKERKMGREGKVGEIVITGDASGAGDM